MTLMKIFTEGGFIMYPLLICSIAIWWVAFEKFWFLLKFKKEYLDLNDRATNLMQEKKYEEAKGLFANARDLISAPYITLLDSKEETKELREDRVSRRLTETSLGLKRFMWILGTIGSSAPFIGLFGTVVGIIKAFKTIRETGKSGFSVVAGDLSEALIATAAGILVAVIAVMFYNYFQTRISVLNQEFKNKLEDLSDYL